MKLANICVKYSERFGLMKHTPKPTAHIGNYIKILREDFLFGATLKSWIYLIHV